MSKHLFYPFLLVMAGLFFSGCDGQNCCMRSALVSDLGDTPLTLSWEEESEASFTITSSLNWRLLPDSVPEWCHVDPVDGSGGETTVTAIIIQSSNDLTERSGTLVFLGANGDRAEVQLIQQPFPSYSLTVSNLSIQSANIYGRVEITKGAATRNRRGAEITVKATATYGFVKWISSDDAESDAVSTEAEYSFTITENTTLYGVFEAPYTLGAYYPDPDDAFSAEGVVFWLDKPVKGSDGKLRSAHGKMVSLIEGSSLQWDTGNYRTEANSKTDGRANMSAIANYISHNPGRNWTDDFPAFNWVITKMNGKTDWNPDDGQWYLPDSEELKALGAGMSGFNYSPEVAWNDNKEMPDYNKEEYRMAQTSFNTKLQTAGGTKIDVDGNVKLWSSSQYGESSTQASCLYVGKNLINYSMSKTILNQVRAVRYF